MHKSSKRSRSRCTSAAASWSFTFQPRLIWSTGSPRHQRRCPTWIAGRAVESCVSEEVLAEYGEVLGRAKFAGLDPHRVARLLAVIAEEATLVGQRIGWLNLATSPITASTNVLQRPRPSVS